MELTLDWIIGAWFEYSAYLVSMAGLIGCRWRASTWACAPRGGDSDYDDLRLGREVRDPAIRRDIYWLIGTLIPGSLRLLAVELWAGS